MNGRSPKSQYILNHAAKTSEHRGGEVLEDGQGQWWTGEEWFDRPGSCPVDNGGADEVMQSRCRCSRWGPAPSPQRQTTQTEGKKLLILRKTLPSVGRTRAQRYTGTKFFFFFFFKWCYKTPICQVHNRLRADTQYQAAWAKWGSTVCSTGRFTGKCHQQWTGTTDALSAAAVQIRGATESGDYKCLELGGLFRQEVGENKICRESLKHLFLWCVDGSCTMITGWMEAEIKAALTLSY